MDMVKADGFRSVIFCARLLVLCDSFVSAAQVVTSKTLSPSGSCHLIFPAISEATLFSDHPVLKDPSDGDMIDFYGPCDYDPLGRASVLRQRYKISVPYAQTGARLKDRLRNPPVDAHEGGSGDSIINTAASYSTSLIKRSTRKALSFSCARCVPTATLERLTESQLGLPKLFTGFLVTA